jgi:hypothetical protein
MAKKTKKSCCRSFSKKKGKFCKRCPVRAALKKKERKKLLAA